MIRLPQRPHQQRGVFSTLPSVGGRTTPREDRAADPIRPLDSAPRPRPSSHALRLAQSVVLVGMIVGSVMLALPVAAFANASSAPLPDPTRSATLTIHKLAAPEQLPDLPHDGTPVDTTGQEPLPGVGFTVTRISGIDLTTASGWRQGANLQGALDQASNDRAEASIVAAGYGLIDPQAKVTGTNGDAVFSGLPLGLYLVEETSSPSGSAPSRPTVVALPMTDPAGLSAWLYDIHMYPKNALVTVTKTVSDPQAYGPSDIVTWTIAADIPNPVDPSAIDGYKITDTVDRRLAVTGVVVSLSDGTPLPPSSYVTTGPGSDRLLTISFTPIGLAALTAHRGSRVIVAVSTHVLEPGDIDNTAVLYPNQASFTIAPGQPGGPIESNLVTTKWGSITVAKVDDGGRPLAGAVFALYRTAHDAGTHDNPIELGGVTTFRVDSKGIVTLAPLRYSDWADGSPVGSGDSGFHDYYLVETVAPAGYQLLTDPIRVRVDADTTSTGIDLTVTNMASAATEHQSDTTPGWLASTGAPIVRNVAIGLVLLAAGLGLFGLARRLRPEPPAQGTLDLADEMP